MNIGFYLDTNHLKEFSIRKFKSGELGLSGTDFSFMRVFLNLQERYGQEHKFILYTTKVLAEAHLTSIIHVENFKECIERVQKDDIHIIIRNYNYDSSFIKDLELGKEKVKFIIWAHNPMRHTDLEYFYNHAHIAKIVMVSEYESNSIRHQNAIYKSIVIHNGLEVDTYTKNQLLVPQEKSIVFLGSLTPSKGFHHLAKIWKSIIKQEPKAKLYVLGSGKLYNNHSQMGSLQIADTEYEEQYIKPYLGKDLQEIKRNNVEFLGLLNRNQIIDILSKSKVACINPNTDGALESCSVSSLEIQLSGLPIVAGKAGGNLFSIVDKKSGFLVKGEDQLRSAILTLLENDELNLTMRKYGRHFVSTKYNIDNIVDQWLALFETIYAQKTTPIPKLHIQPLDVKVLVKEAIRLVKYATMSRNR